MSTFRRFEDILAWQKARGATRCVYGVTLKEGFGRDFGLRDQLRKASVSVMANIAEGFGRRSDKEFANFLNIAHGSALECQSHVYVALDLGYVTRHQFDELYGAFEECSKMIIALSHHLQQSKPRS